MTKQKVRKKKEKRKKEEKKNNNCDLGKQIYLYIALTTKGFAIGIVAFSSIVI